MDVLASGLRPTEIILSFIFEPKFRNATEIEPMTTSAASAYLIKVASGVDTPNTFKGPPSPGPPVAFPVPTNPSASNAFGPIVSRTRIDPPSTVDVFATVDVLVDAVGKESSAVPTIKDAEGSAFWPLPGINDEVM